jgi:hypothetical protein
MKMHIPLYAALVCASALSACGDGSGTPVPTSANSTDNALADTRPATNDSPVAAQTRETANPASTPPSPGTLSAAATAPGDPPSAPIAMSPGVMASIDPPGITRPSRIPLSSATGPDADTEVQVQPVVHYPPDSSDGS